MEETIELTKRLWIEEAALYDGEYYQLSEAVCKPHPV